MTYATVLYGVNDVDGRQNADTTDDNPLMWGEWAALSWVGDATKAGVRRRGAISDGERWKRFFDIVQERMPSFDLLERSSPSGLTPFIFGTHLLTELILLVWTPVVSRNREQLL